MPPETFSDIMKRLPLYTVAAVLGLAALFSWRWLEPRCADIGCFRSGSKLLVIDGQTRINEQLVVATDIGAKPEAAGVQGSSTGQHAQPDNSETSVQLPGAVVVHVDPVQAAGSVQTGAGSTVVQQATMSTVAVTTTSIASTATQQQQQQAAGAGGVVANEAADAKYQLPGQVGTAPKVPPLPDPLPRQAAVTSEGDGISRPAISPIAALLARPAGLHGRLVKGKKDGGFPVVFQRGLDLHRYRVALRPEEWNQDVRSWIEAVRSLDLSHGISYILPDGAAAKHFRSPAPSCFYFVDHTYKVIYARSTLTGDAPISKVFGLINNAELCGRDPKACAKNCAGKALCLNRTLDDSELASIWHEYTVFGVSRNPFARAVASWTYINERFLPNTSCVDSFEDFALLPSAYVERCMTERNAQWLGALNHLEPQAECVFSRQGETVVDFLARSEALDEDVQDLVQLINERRPLGTPAIPPPKLPRPNAAALAVKYAFSYEGKGSTALTDLGMYFDEDLRMMKFDRSLGAAAA